MLAVVHRLCRGASASSNAPALLGARRCMSGTNEPAEPSIIEKARAAVGRAVEAAGEAFEGDGKIGRKFQPDGPVGGTAQQVGGPLDKEGAMGHQFTEEGSVGGTVQAAAEKVDAKGEEMQAEAAHKQGEEAVKEATPGLRRDTP